MALIRIINEESKGPLLTKIQDELVSCGRKVITHIFTRDYTGDIAFAVKSNSAMTTHIFIGKDFNDIKSDEISEAISGSKQITKSYRIDVKKGYQAKIIIDNGQFMVYDNDDKHAQCGEPAGEVIAKGVNHATYMIGFGGKEQYGGEFDTPVYIPKPAQPAENSGGGGYYDDGHRDNAPDLPSGNYVPIGGHSNEWERSM